MHSPAKGPALKEIYAFTKSYNNFESSYVTICVIYLAPAQQGPAGELLEVIAMLMIPAITQKSP